MSIDPLRICQSEDHRTGIFGHSGPAAHLVRIRCQRCGRDERMAMCAGRVKYGVDGQTMKCRRCGHIDATTSCWTIEPLPQTVKAPTKSRPAPPKPTVRAETITWDDLLDRYRTHLLAAGRSLATIRLRLSNLRQFAKGQPDPLAASGRDLERFLAERRETHRPETRASIRASLRGFYAWATEEALIPVDPAARLLPIRRPVTTPRVAPDVDLQHALAGASPDQRAVILLARFGCLRRAEIAALRAEDRRDGILHVRGKGEKQRRVPLNPQLADALHAIEPPEGHGFYFPGRMDGHIHVDTIHHVITTLTGWNPHSLRHAGATAAYRATRNLRAVQQLLGHASIATTERYIHIDADELRAVADTTALGFEND